MEMEKDVLEMRNNCKKYVETELTIIMNIVDLQKMSYIFRSLMKIVPKSSGGRNRKSI